MSYLKPQEEMEAMEAQENNIFDVQPEWCRAPLPYKELEIAYPYYRRTIELDPIEVYNRIGTKLQPFNRYNWQIQFTDLFPKPEDGTCSCGCGRVLPKGKPRWYEKDCQMFAVCVWNVIGGRQDFIGLILSLYNQSDKCVVCNEKKYTEVDHIWPVSKGGSGSWLTNYQLLCKRCHVKKTREDMGWTKLKKTKE